LKYKLCGEILTQYFICSSAHGTDGWDYSSVFNHINLELIGLC